MKSIVRRSLGWIPIEFKLKQDDKALPDASLESIHLVLAYYSHLGLLPRLVQVGACDGVSEDPVCDFIKLGKFRAVVVEPVPGSVKRLRQTYERIANVTVIQAAVGKHDGEASLFKVKDGARSIDPYWSSQVASFNRKHLLHHHVAEDDIEEIKVPCLTLKSLLKACHFDSVEILQIDTEGFDAEIVSMALELPVVPECINFEHLHLGSQSRQHLFSRLRASGYAWTHDRWNTLAVHEGLRMRWLKPENMLNDKKQLLKGT